jgi:hypothetical protein
MKCGVRFYLTGTVLLLALAGCGRSFLHFGEERAAWRHEAEVACLKSGAVKVGAGVVQMKSIEGPGVCGADFPLKVALLGETPGLGYADELRPPEAIPNASAAQPRWPMSEPHFVRAPVQPVQVQPLQGQQMRWVPGPPGIERPATTAPAVRPISLSPPGVEPGVTPSAAPLPDDIPDDAVLPPGQAPSAYPPQRGYGAPVYRPPPQRVLPALGPMRGPNASAAIMPAAVTPPATLACPLVSALDRWVSDGVQPAALHWFGAPVTEIKQISAYSCREMVGSGTSTISEHAFGNALDIAGFTLADGRQITVKNGWHGTPEEQGFLHDVQLYACETFSTVLAPGYNVYHYDHIHVDLMRRQAGYRPCRPDAIPGEVAAAKARAVYASKQRGPAYTGSLPAKAKLPVAIAGADGLVASEDDDAETGAIAAPGGVDHDYDLDVAAPPPLPHAPSRTAGDAVRAQEQREKFY